MRTKPFILTSICGTVLLLVAAGTGLYINEMNQKNLANGEKISRTQALTEDLPDDLLSVDEIKSIVIDETPNTTVHTIVLEKSEDVYQYKAKLTNGSIVYFNARTGARISTMHDDSASPATPIDTTKIGFNDARKIALATNPGGIVSKIELLTENGSLNYCVWFGESDHIDVRANDGLVTHVDLRRSTPPQSKAEVNAQQPAPPALDKVENRVRENVTNRLNLPL